MFEEVLVEQNKHWQNIKYDAGIRRTVLDKALTYMDMEAFRRWFLKKTTKSKKIS